MRSTADSTRRLRLWAAALFAELLLGGALTIDAQRRAASEDGAGASDLAETLELSGLALGSGAAYARHPAQADLFAPWSEHPGALEHLPSGSLIPAIAAWPETEESGSGPFRGCLP